MSVYEAITQAINIEIRHLIQSGLVVHPAVARNVLRVEIADDALSEYLESRTWADRPPYYADHIGPMVTFGVATYGVRRLPAPGWRIINPFRKER